MILDKFNSPKMYKVSKTGAIQVWWISTEGSSVETHHGQLGGKITVDKYVAKAKNVGRSNETTAEQQAVLEAEAKVKDRLTNKQYMPSEEEAREHFDNCMTPMKIERFDKKGHTMTYPAYVQRKFNGSRLTRVKGTTYNKSGRPDDIKVDHLKEILSKLPDEFDFDGEVYCHGYSLQTIRSAALKENKNTHNLMIMIFDVPQRGVPFKKRVEALKRLEDYIFDNNLEEHFWVELPVLVYNEQEYLTLHEQLTYTKEEGIESNYKLDYVRDGEGDLKLDPKGNAKTVLVDNPEAGQQILLGYEGTVIRKQDSYFEFGQRSSDTMKLKDRVDGEAKVLSVEKDKLGEGVLTCRTSKDLGNIVFSCKMKVDRRDGIKYDRSYHNMTALIDKWITFSYEELSDKGVPTKPVGELERDCDEDGEPLE